MTESHPRRALRRSNVPYCPRTLYRRRSCRHDRVLSWRNLADHRAICGFGDADDVAGL
jgi:hypothetical protein